MNIQPMLGFFEPISSLTHLVGAVVFALLAIPLLRRARGDRRRVALLGVYSCACVLLLSMSGVFHILPDGCTGRAVLGRLDKAAIFVLIAGTHTPVQGLFYRGIARWGVLLAMWLVAATGITLFTVFYDVLPRGLGTSVYLLLGWIATASGLFVWRHVGTAQITLLMAGGLVYSIGAILLGLGWPTIAPGLFDAHELWHFVVLAGMGLHWAFLFKNANRPLDG